MDQFEITGVSKWSSNYQTPVLIFLVAMVDELTSDAVRLLVLQSIGPLTKSKDKLRTAVTIGGQAETR
jgi:hypothetical protein